MQYCTGNHVPCDTTSSPKSSFAWDKDIWNIFILAQQRKVQHDLYGHGVCCQNDKCCSSPVELFCCFICPFLQLFQVGALLSEIKKRLCELLRSKGERLVIHLCHWKKRMASPTLIDEKYCTASMNEVPKVSEAMKNFFTIKLAEGFTNASSLQVLAKLVLNAINGFTMLLPEKWAQKHPQRADQSGRNRLDEMGHYNVHYAMWLAVKKNPDAKVTKLFGRTFLKQIWQDLKERILAAGAPSGFDDLFPPFLSAFEEELEEDSQHSLVWTSNFAAALACRQRARQEVVNLRAVAAAAAEDEVVDIAHKLVAQANGDDHSS
eukprot:GGOE01013531.1.p1 GENE.GGOE01013531.1~~GGOE01013531.1.p1  ORF type:complete len:320 (-),score=47.89 GGOE01013531.1:280-1239(-)